MSVFHRLAAGLCLLGLFGCGADPAETVPPAATADKPPEPPRPAPSPVVLRIDGHDVPVPPPGVSIQYTKVLPSSNQAVKETVSGVGAGLEAVDASAIGTFQTDTPRGSVGASTGGGRTAFDYKTLAPGMGIGVAVIGGLLVVAGGVMCKYDMGVGVKVGLGGLVVVGLGVMAPVFQQQGALLVGGALLVMLVVGVLAVLRLRGSSFQRKALKHVVKGLDVAKGKLSKRLDSIVDAWAAASRADLQPAVVADLKARLADGSTKAITEPIRDEAGSDEPLVRSTVDQARTN